MPATSSVYEPGFEIEIFSEAPPERLICGICLCVVRSPQQTSCGHRYCAACLKEVAHRSRFSFFACPICKSQQRISDSVFDDRAIEREVGDLYVFCTDCSSTRIQFSDLKRHRESLCQERIESCRLKCGFRGKLASRDLHERHACLRRPTQCSICSLSMTIGDFGPHSILCLAGMLVPCLRCRSSLSLTEKRKHEVLGCAAAATANENRALARRRRPPRKYCYYQRQNRRRFN